MGTVSGHFNRWRRVQDVLAPLDRALVRQFHRGVYAIAEESTARFERPAWAMPASSAPRHDRAVFTRTSPRPSTSCAYSWAREQSRRRRRHRAQRDGAPRQHHPVAHARGRARRRAALDPADRRLPPRPHRPRRTPRGAKLLAITAMSNALGTVNDLPPSCRARLCRGRPRTRRRFAGGATPRDRRAVVGRRLRRRSPRTRCSARRASALSWGRRDLLEAMPPFLGGGEILRYVRKNGFTKQYVV